MELLINLLKIVMSLTVLYVALILLVVFLLWLLYDRPLTKLHSKLKNVDQEMNEHFKGRGVTKEGIRPHIDAKKRPLKNEIDKLEYRRRLFLDRIKILLMIKLGK